MARTTPRQFNISQPNIMTSKPKRAGEPPKGHNPSDLNSGNGEGFTLIATMRSLVAVLDVLRVKRPEELAEMTTAVLNLGKLPEYDQVNEMFWNAISARLDSLPTLFIPLSLPLTVPRPPEGVQRWDVKVCEE